jgi:uncharacterized repeat protein (TIGR01451 family)
MLGCRAFISVAKLAATAALLLLVFATTASAIGPPPPDLATSVSDTPDPVGAGADLTYTITVTNNGGSASGMTLADALPSGTTFVSLSVPAGFTCTTPAVGANGSVSCSTSDPIPNAATNQFTLVVNVDPSVADGSVLVDTATANTVGDSNTGNDSGTATTTVAGATDLTITMSDSPDPIDPGADLTYTIDLTNNGPAAARNVSVSDTLPSDTTFVSYTAPVG